MKAVNHYIIVENIKIGPKKVAGLIMTDLYDDDRYIKAKIISAGNLVEGLKNKDIVYYDKHAGHTISWKDNNYYVIQSRDVVLIE